MFRTDPVRASVPATSANLGPGFDTLGLALSLYDDVTARITESGTLVTITGEGAGEVPTDERHLIVATMDATFEALGVARPPGLELTCHNRIPHARGLGSSAAAIVAGILLARAIVDEGAARLDEAAVLRMAAAIEGHADNVAACLMGGFTISWTEQAGARAIRLEPLSGVSAIVLIPATRGLTEQARLALPTSVPHADAAFNAARTALLVHALTIEPDLLFEATADRLHQAYRAPGMPDTAELVSRLRDAGVAAVVSGAGPSVLAFLTGWSGTSDDAALRERLEIPSGWHIRPLSSAKTGARILVAGHAEGDPVAAGVPS